MTELLQSFRVPNKNQITSIRMSKLDRLLESAKAKKNWSEMVKMLFWNDNDEDRQKEMVRFVSPEGKFLTAAFSGPEWSKDQLRFVVLLMVIVAIAENRTQEIYEKDFSQRCDAISQVHGLKDNQYWNAENVPAEWEQLNKEFEQVSNQVLVGTLREYHQNEIADLIQDQGPDQIFEIIQNIQVNRLTTAKYSRGVQATDTGENL